MIIAVMSDTHGGVDNVRWLLEQVWKYTGPIDAYVHLGDGAYDFEQLESFIRARDPQAKMYGVRGNNDWGSMDIPDTRIETFGGVRMLLTHGHRYHVRATYDCVDLAARERGCRIALFGHTHVQDMEMRSILLLNPGSTNNDRMALIHIDDKGDIRPELIEY